MTSWGAAKDARLSAAQAGYMELVGAKKDAECAKVRVTGGVSKELGCCNYFEPEAQSVTQFRCGTCEYKKGKNHA